MRVRTKADKKDDIKNQIKGKYTTQMAFAMACDVNPSIVTKFCSEKYTFPLSTYQELAANLGLSWEEIGEIVTGSLSSESVDNTSAPTAIPHTLPPLTQLKLVGREEEMQTLRARLQQRHSENHPIVVVVHGMPGVGRTELVNHYAWEHLPDYPGGICWVTGSDGKLATRLLEYARAKFVDTPIPPDRTALECQLWHCFHHWTGNDQDPVLVIFDEVTDYALLKPLLDGLPPRFRVLITACEKPDAYDTFRTFYSLPIEPLSRNHAVSLLQTFILEKDDWRDPQDMALKDIAEKLGCLPLALQLVGNYLRRAGQDFSFAEILEKLHQQKVSDVEREIVAAFELTWNLLGEEAQRLACLLSLLDMSFIDWKQTEEMLVKVGRFSAPESPRTSLQDYHLLERKKTGVYALHGLIEQYCLAKLPGIDADGSLRAAVARLQWEAIRDIPLPERPQLSQIAAIPGAALTSLEKLIRHFPTAIDKDVLPSILTAVRRFYQGQCLYGHALSAVQTGLPIVEQEFGPESSETAELYHAIGGLYYFQRQAELAEPWLAQALVKAEALKDELLIARILQAQAAFYRDTARNFEDLMTAQATAKRGLEIQERLLGRTHPDTADSLMTLALIHLYADQYSEAEPLLLEVLELRESLGDPNNPDVGESCNGLGGLYQKQGKVEEARRYHIKALRFRRRVHGKAHPQTAESYHNLGKVYAREKFAKAEKHYKQAFAIFDSPAHRNDHKFERGWCLKNLGELYITLEKLDAAHPAMTQALLLLTEECGSDHPRTQECESILKSLRTE